MCISTSKGWKIIRKLSSIADKEHLSVKILQINPSSYHNDLLIASQCWLGETPNFLQQYYSLIHPYTPDAP
jgi:hypothetical protein